jgi:hypothetical protein
LVNDKLWRVMRDVNRDQSARNDFFNNPRTFLAKYKLSLTEELMLEIEDRVKKLKNNPIPGYQNIPTDLAMQQLIDKTSDNPTAAANPDDFLIN